MRFCTKCKQTKPEDKFAFKNKADGTLKTWCKECTKESSAAYYQKNKEKISLRTSEYRKENLGLYAEATRRWRANNPEKNKLSIYKWRNENPDAIKAIDRRSYAKNVEKKRLCAQNRYWKNRDKWISYARNYRLENKEKRRVFAQNRRSKLLSRGKLSNGIIDKLMRLQMGKCACCGRPLGNKYHIDHIMPIALGGSNTDDNVQLLRAECNQRKHAKHPIDYMQSKGYLL